MSTALPCPGCRSPVAVPPDHPGGPLNCGICWTELDAPAAGPKPAAVRPAVARALPVGPPPVKAAPLPAGAKPAPGMAKLDALVQKAESRAEAPPPVAKALPAKAKPVAAALPAPAKPKYRSRGDGDDDDSDRPPPKTKGGNGLLIGLAVGGIVLLLGAAGIIYIGYKAFEEQVGRDADTPQLGPLADNNPNPLPQFNVPPVANLPQPIPIDGGGVNPRPGNAPAFVPPPPGRRPPAFPDAVWAPVDRANGFEAVLPGRPTVLDTWAENLHPAGARPAIGHGAKYMANDHSYAYEITYLDAPEGSAPDLRKLAAGFNAAADVRTVRFQARDAEEFEKDDGALHIQTRRAFQVGCRVFVLGADLRAIGGRDREHLRAQHKKFFDGFTVTFDPATPAPPDPFAPRPRPGRRAGGVPGFVEPGPIGVWPTAAKLEPFWAATVLPKAGEVWTFGTRVVGGGRLGGVLRRYAYPGFAPKNTYYLPFPVTYAAVDEAAGKLAVAAVTKPDVSLAERERNVGFGDVHLYDIAPVLRGKLAERDELKPAASAGFAAKIAGLVPVKDGAVVLTLTQQPANRAKPWLAKLSRVEWATGSVTKKLDLPEPAWRLVPGPNNMAYCAEVPLSPVGAPLLGTAKTGTVMAVDLATFQKDRTVTFPGIVVDLDAAADGTLLAAVSAGPELKLVAAPPGGGTVEFTPPAGAKPTENYVALTPDGTRLVSSARGAFGVFAADVTNLSAEAGLGKRATAGQAGIPAAPLGGAFTFTPDGRYALFQSGAVIEVAAMK